MESPDDFKQIISIGHLLKKPEASEIECLNVIRIKRPHSSGSLTNSGIYSHKALRLKFSFSYVVSTLPADHLRSERADFSQMTKIKKDTEVLTFMK